MWLEEVEKLSKQQLRLLINRSFELAEEPGRDRGPLYEKAAFYMRELEHRRDSWVSIRDFILEIVVIALIGWEIWLGYGAEHLQKTNFEAEKQVFDNLEKSSGGTAGSLIAAQQLLQNMNGALQKELALFYDVSLSVVFDSEKQQLHFTNNGRTNISIWELAVGDVSFAGEHEGRVIIPGGGYQLDGAAVYNFVAGRLPRPTDGLVGFNVYVKNERSEEFVVHGYFAMHWVKDAGHMNVQIESIVPEAWTRIKKKVP